MSTSRGIFAAPRAESRLLTGYVREAVQGIARRAAVSGLGEAVDVVVHALIPEQFDRLDGAR